MTEMFNQGVTPWFTLKRIRSPDTAVCEIIRISAEEHKIEAEELIQDSKKWCEMIRCLKTGGRYSSLVYHSRRTL